MKELPHSSQRCVCVLRVRTLGSASLKVLLAILVLREKHADALVGNGRVAKLSPLRRHEKTATMSRWAGNSDFKEHRHLGSPGREFPPVAWSQYDILVTD